MRRIPEEVARHEVRVVEGLAEVLDGRARHTLALEPFDPVLDRLARRDRLDVRDQPRPVAEAVVDVGIARVAFEPLESERTTQALPGRGRGRAHGEPAVLGADGLIRGAVLVRRAEAAGYLAGREVFARLPDAQ
jgi:hypothetical protein